MPYRSPIDRIERRDAQIFVFPSDIRPNREHIHRAAMSVRWLPSISAFVTLPEAALTGEEQFRQIRRAVRDELGDLLDVSPSTRFVDIPEALERIIRDEASPIPKRTPIDRVEHREGRFFIYPAIARPDRDHVTRSPLNVEWLPAISAFTSRPHPSLADDVQFRQIRLAVEEELGEILEITPSTSFIEIPASLEWTMREDATL